MISDQFRRDYRQMTAQGVTFTPEDIIRLNALSVKTRRAATAAADVYLPRLAFLPRDSWWRAPLVLREPTIAHDLWIEMAERILDTSKDEVFLFLHAFALSRHPGRLPDPTRPKKVVKAVLKFASKRLYKFTKDQLKAAVEYALFGNDWTVGESGPRSEVKGQTDRSARDSRAQDDAGVLVGHEHYGEGSFSPSPTLGILADGRMLRLPISTDDAMRMTSSELSEAINRAWELDGKFDRKRARTAAFGEYVRAREEIRSRSKAKSTSPVDAPPSVDAPSSMDAPPSVDAPSSVDAPPSVDAFVSNASNKDTSTDIDAIETIASTSFVHRH